MIPVSICTDMDALRATGLVGEESPYRGKIDGRSGKHVQYSPDGTKSMIVITSIDELEGLAELPFVTVTSLEEIHGYKKQVEIDGELQWTEEVVTVPAYTPQVVVGYTDGDPIYKVVRHEKQKTVTRTHDEDGNELPEPLIVPVVKTSYVYGEDGEVVETIETPVMELDYYETTDEVIGYKQVPTYGNAQEWISPVMVDSGELDESGLPVYIEETPGYYQDVVIPESSYTVQIPVLEEVPGDPELKALYDSIYLAYTVDEEGVHVPRSKYFAIPGGYDSSHLL